jgi:sugar phosphate isomerase/epimerase
MSLSYGRGFREGRVDLLSFIEKAREMELDGVDLHTAGFASQERGYLQKVKEECLRHGLTIACVSIPNEYGNPEKGNEAEVAMTKSWIETAHFLGAPLVRVFAGHARPDEDEKVAWQRIVKSLTGVAIYGQQVGIKVCLQNHNHLALTRTGDDVLKMINEVGPDLLGHVLDTGQYAGSPGSSGNTKESERRYDFYRSMEQTAHLALHVRAKLYFGGSMITKRPDAQIDYDWVFRLLKRVRYNGFISLVYEGLEPEETAVPKGVKFLREHIEKSHAG